MPDDHQTGTVWLPVPNSLPLDCVDCVDCFDCVDSLDLELWIEPTHLLAHRDRVGWGQRPEGAEPVESEKIRIVVVVRTTLAVIVGGTNHRDDVRSVEMPIRILKP